MAILPIVMYPDEILEQKCDPVITFDKKLAKLLNNMYETMVEADGVGLAAPQIGVKKQAAVVDIGDETGKIEIINPEVLEVAGEQTGPEGCLSFPGLYGEVSRPFKVKIRAQDRKGRYYELKADDFLARAILHEIDHLNGVLFTSKVSHYIKEDELERYEQE
ncbi:peptide deformylase [Peribacillus deserti]|uniref:Peptide deformylase n=1 Tax=Peribacillus deserti TaxID=673318 RepID=A0ABS2QJ52_9BACI|nr:peptide deformylase [Peribacillus deserti]MBM7692321.1 peptide deformylase [Peribacillus deserti]